MQHAAVRWTLVAFGSLVAVHSIAFVALLLLQRDHADTVAPNVVVDGVEVGGLSEPELRDTVQAHAAERLEEPVVVIADDDRLEATRRQLGERIDTAGAVEGAWGHGRGFLWSALAEQIRMRAGGWHEIDLPRRLDREHLDAWTRDAAQRLSREPRAADLALVTTDGDVEVEVTEPVTGFTVHAGALADTLAGQLADTPGPLRVSAPLEDVRAPAVTEADLDTALTAVERATSEAVVLSNPSPADELVLEPLDLAQLLIIEQDLDAEEGARLRVSVDHDALRDRLEDGGMDRFRAEPVEASFSVVDGELEVEGGTVGFDPDPDPIPELVVELATAEDGERQAQLPGEVLEPRLSQQRAEELGIVEQVSSFTTPLVPGQPRNTNLQRAAEVLNGSVILPGERFSLDDTLGPRSRERGFVENGYIRDGEMVSVVGGGVSQMATTFLNAAWFAGIELVEFQPHSLYFSRYPMGREATMARRLIDLVVENDSPYGILITSEADERELTVSFWSTPWAEVDSHTGEPYNRRAGRLRDGFTVDVTRTVTYPDGSSQTETYTHTYRPENQPR